MLKVGLIGYGAIAQYVSKALPAINAELVLVVVRARRLEQVSDSLGPEIKVVEEMGSERPDIVVDCAGHSGLEQHGIEILSAGVPLITVSIGALANSVLYSNLVSAAKAGGCRLHLSSGAIGGLDALASARCGQLESVLYIGRKPPLGWAGSHAESVLDLNSVHTEASIHYEGSARDAALLYPKNANVAAAVALAGLGFDDTRVQLIADPMINENNHQIVAKGDFGEMQFSITGRTFPDNARTSALAAMSVVRMLENQMAYVSF